MIRRFALLLLLALAATPAAAQLRVDITQGMSAPLPVAVPGFATPAPTGTAAGNTAALGGQVASVIGNDLKSSGLFRPVGPTDAVAFAQTTAPAYETWRSAAAQALVTGAVTANADGTITIACYLYDPFAQQQLASEGFRVTPPAWRRAAHKCADKVYTRLTGEGGYFDSQIVYVAESGPKTHRRKQLAIMDQDGANHRFLTNGQSLVLTPRFAPNQGRVAYMSFAGNRPALWFYDAITGRTSIVGTFQGTSFSPRFSADEPDQGGQRQHLSARSRGQGARPADGRGFDRYLAELFARWQQDRVRERSWRHAAALHRERRWRRRAPAELWPGALRDARVEPAR